ncbi:MAG: inosine monophosphate cyclohydrolase [Anaerotruncus sp.]|nr:inosine monophosphate cyclohydrolase [Anaerotruncus sp.]
MNQIQEIGGLLRANSYPGRGIIIGKSATGTHMVAAYFIMGRSENSRNRVFVEDGEGIRTQAYDPSKLSDPSLIIYAPVRVLGDTTIVTNGDQTDTIYQFMEQGKTFADALRTRTFEPDAPNFTPRISAVLCGGNYQLSILKSEDQNPEYTRRYFYEYDGCVPGTGHFLHTYQCDGNPIPSFIGEPERVSVEGDIDTYTKTLWEALNPDNKVSLFVRFISLADGSCETRIQNKNQ